MKEHWKAVIDRQPQAEIEEILFINDPFLALATDAEKYDVRAMRISATASTSTDYGQQKLTVTVSGPCAPREAAINMAGEVALLKSIELVNNAARALGLPTLGGHVL